MAKKYEYLTASLLDPFAKNSGVAEQARAALSEYGAEGWQVLKIEREGNIYRGFLMREVSETPEQ